MIEMICVAGFLAVGIALDRAAFITERSILTDSYPSVDALEQKFGVHDGQLDFFAVRPDESGGFKPLLRGRRWGTPNPAKMVARDALPHPSGPTREFRPPQAVATALLGQR
jgi:hypothetical protein